MFLNKANLHFFCVEGQYHWANAAWSQVHSTCISVLWLVVDLLSVFMLLWPSIERRKALMYHPKPCVWQDLPPELCYMQYQTFKCPYVACRWNWKTSFLNTTKTFITEIGQCLPSLSTLSAALQMLFRSCSVLLFVNKVFCEWGMVRKNPEVWFCSCITKLVLLCWMVTLPRLTYQPGDLSADDSGTPLYLWLRFYANSSLF